MPDAVGVGGFWQSLGGHKGYQMPLFKSSEDNEIIQELLPYVHPHEGVLRAQLHRDGNPAEKEELRFIFSFTCGKCDHKKLLATLSPSTSSRRCTREGTEQCRGRRRRCGRLVALHGPGGYVFVLPVRHRDADDARNDDCGRVRSVVGNMVPGKPIQYARLLRNTWLQVPGADYYELPADHPWNKRTPEDWK